MIKAHRNLHSLRKNSSVKPWSYYPHGSKHVRGADEMVLFDVTAKHGSGKKFDACLAGEGNRSVFAWLKAEQCTVENKCYPGFDYHKKKGTAKRLRFNPTKGERFFHCDGVKMDSASVVWLFNNGEAWAIPTASEEN